MPQVLTFSGFTHVVLSDGHIGLLDEIDVASGHFQLERIHRSYETKYAKELQKRQQCNSAFK